MSARVCVCVCVCACARVCNVVCVRVCVRVCVVVDLQRLPASSPPSHQPPQVHQLPLGRRALPWTLAQHGVPATYTHAHMTYTHAHMHTHSHSWRSCESIANDSPSTYLSRAVLGLSFCSVHTQRERDGMGMCVCVCVCMRACVHVLLTTYLFSFLHLGL